VSGIEPLTCRLQEVRPPAPSALAAPMARVIALMTPVALRLSGGTFHEPFHAYCRHHPVGVTKHSSQEQLRRYRDLPGSDRTVDQVRCTAESDRAWNQGGAPMRRRVRRSSRRALRWDARPARPRRPSHSSTTNLGGSIGSPVMSAAQGRHPRLRLSRSRQPHQGRLRRPPGRLRALTRPPLPRDLRLRGRRAGPGAQ